MKSFLYFVVGGGLGYWVKSKQVKWSTNRKRKGNQARDKRKRLEERDHAAHASCKGSDFDRIDSKGVPQCGCFTRDHKFKRVSSPFCSPVGTYTKKEADDLYWSGEL